MPTTLMSQRQTFLFLLKASLSIALIVIVARRVDLDLVWFHLSVINFGLVALAGALVALQIIVGSQRWKAIISAQGACVHSATALRIYYIGVFFNMCTPGGFFGDVIRIWHAHRTGLAIPSAISSVILDRIV